MSERICKMMFMQVCMNLHYSFETGGINVLIHEIVMKLQFTQLVQLFISRVIHGYIFFVHLFNLAESARIYFHNPRKVPPLWEYLARPKFPLSKLLEPFSA